jgi:fatty acid desaturase
MRSERSATQDYAPYRQSAIDAGTLEELYRLDPRIPVRHTLLLWLQIVACWVVVACWPYWWVVLAALPVIGTRYYALYIIGHDGLHRRIFPQVRSNDLWTDLFLLGPIGAITRLNRHNHMRHHATLALPEDPDRYKYVSYGGAAATLWRLTGVPFVLRAVGNVFLNRHGRGTHSPKEGYTWRDIAILALWQALLIGALSAAIGWWAFPVLWLLPVYAFTFAADISRVFFEHSSVQQEAAADARKRLVSFHAPWWERVLLAPMNMNLHAAHHLWPAIPYYRLPAADTLLRAKFGTDNALTWRPSYFGYLLEYLRAQRNGVKANAA